MIDAHQHFWTLARDDYGWLTPDDEVLYRDFAPKDLAPLLDSVAIERSVLVQAAPTVAETRYLLEIADRTSWVAAVVGWVALEDSAVEDTLDALVANSAFRGVRPMIQDLPDDDWMLREDVARGLRAVAARELAFDALVHPRHLSRLATLLRRHPDLHTVIDHAAKPAIRSGDPADFDAWSTDMAEIASDSNACCKLSGLVTEAGENWSFDDLRPYVAHLLECFGPQRLMWGSDWPVVELAGGFTRWREATDELLAELSDDERVWILGGTAERFYRLE